MGSDLQLAKTSKLTNTRHELDTAIEHQRLSFNKTAGIRPEDLNLETSSPLVVEAVLVLLIGLR